MHASDIAVTSAGRHPDTDHGFDFGRTKPDLSWRILQLLNAYRVVVGLFLATLFFSFADPHMVGGLRPVLFVGAISGYMVFGFLNLFAVRKRWPTLTSQTYMQLTIDIAIIALLMHASGGINSGLGSLLIVPVAACSLTISQRLAVLFAAIATFAILLQQSISVLAGLTTAAEFTPAGVLSGILITIAFAVSPLAKRIQESEALARQRGVDLRNLAQLNDYIIQHLRESIVVVDANDSIRLINESAAKMLGVKSRLPGNPLEQVSPKLLTLLKSWRAEPVDFQRSQPSFVAAGGDRIINPHFAPLGRNGTGAMLIFLEDASHLSERVQQSKLASLGRLSASIAHEIRNPVGAMSHAGQLLGESEILGPQEKRLTVIIQSNADRVSAIIDNILQLSRRDTTKPERLKLDEWIEDFLSEFRETQQIDQDRIVWNDARVGIEVLIDPTHLHQIMWNLCENAIKYASDTPLPTIELRAGRTRQNNRPYLEVADRGPGIEDVSAEQIFEPFFTGETGGTGLGLFICRELCECNRATLIYLPRDRGGSVFRIIFSDPKRWEAMQND